MKFQITVLELKSNEMKNKKDRATKSGFNVQTGRTGKNVTSQITFHLVDQMI